MPKFFIPPGEGYDNSLVLTGDDAIHIAKTLRMRPGEPLTLCDGAGTDYFCKIISASPSQVVVSIQKTAPCVAEPQLHATLYMALPKADKLELVVQKSVELGVERICVFRSAACVPDPDQRTFEKRLLRLQRIAREAAGQSMRGAVPEVRGLLTYQEMLHSASSSDLALFFYEHGDVPLKTILEHERYQSIALVIGPEGGFTEEEQKLACDAGLKTAYLGARILRCETAALCALSAVMFHAGELA